MNTQESFTVNLDFVDDHATNPLTTQYSLVVTVEFEIAEASDFVFNAEDYTNGQKEQRKELLQPPQMTIGSLDENEKINISFN